MRTASRQKKRCLTTAGCNDFYVQRTNFEVPKLTHHETDLKPGRLSPKVAAKRIGSESAVSILDSFPSRFEMRTASREKKTDPLLRPFKPYDPSSPTRLIFERRDKTKRATLVFVEDCDWAGDRAVEMPYTDACMRGAEGLSEQVSQLAVVMPPSWTRPPTHPPIILRAHPLVDPPSSTLKLSDSLSNNPAGPPPRGPALRLTLK